RIKRVEKKPGRRRIRAKVSGRRAKKRMNWTDGNYIGAQRRCLAHKISQRGKVAKPFGGPAAQRIELYRDTPQGVRFWEERLSGFYGDRFNVFLLEVRQTFHDGGSVVARKRERRKHGPLHLHTHAPEPATGVGPIHFQAGSARETAKAGIRHDASHAQVAKGGTCPSVVSPQIKP